jgi:Tfp pilus assembly protein PilN
VSARLNLSSHPFRNRTLPWTTAVVVSVASLLLIVYVLTEGSRARTQADSTARTVAQMRAEKSAIEAQAEEVRQQVPADQLEVLDAAHALVDRKTFSWSQLFADLEAALPADVRVQRISVREVTQQGGQMRADLEMTVAGRRPDDVTGMMVEMSRLGSFNAVPVTENFKQDRGDRVYEWTLRVTYVQRVKRSGGDSAPERASVAAAAESGRGGARQ